MLNLCKKMFKNYNIRKCPTGTKNNTHSIIIGVRQNCIKMTLKRIASCYNLQLDLNKINIIMITWETNTITV